MRDCMDKRVTPPKRVTSPTWGPPPPRKQALRSTSVVTGMLISSIFIKVHLVTFAIIFGESGQTCRIPESGKFLPVESGILGFGIWSSAQLGV